MRRGQPGGAVPTALSRAARARDRAGAAPRPAPRGIDTPRRSSRRDFPFARTDGAQSMRSVPASGVEPATPGENGARLRTGLEPVTMRIAPAVVVLAVSGLPAHGSR